jgi:hypothetical protein
MQRQRRTGHERGFANCFDIQTKSRRPRWPRWPTFSCHGPPSVSRHSSSIWRKNPGSLFKPNQDCQDGQRLPYHPRLFRFSGKIRPDFGPCGTRLLVAGQSRQSMKMKTARRSLAGPRGNGLGPESAWELNQRITGPPVAERVGLAARADPVFRKRLRVAEKECER